MRSATLKVARFEIMRQLKKPAFWAATLLIPLLIGGIYLISFISSQSVEQNPKIDENTKIAITDAAGVLPSDAPYVIDGAGAIVLRALTVRVSPFGPIRRSGSCLSALPIVRSIPGSPLI